MVVKSAARMRRGLRIHYSSDSEEDSIQPPANAQPTVNRPPAAQTPPNPNPNLDEPLPISSDEDYFTPPSPAADSPIGSLLLNLGLSLKREWINSCLQGLESSVSGFSQLDDSAKAKLCFQQFLFSDMNHSGAGVLPENVHSLHLVDLKGPFVLQVDEIVNISGPLRGRYHEAASSVKRCLKLSMTDGIQRVFGMEYRPIKDLQVLAPSGLKVAICNVHVRRGLLMLVPETVEVLGGMVQELDAARQRLVNEVNKPPRGKRTRTGVAPSLATRATLAAWPSNGDSATGHVDNSTAQNVTPMHVDNSTSHNAAHRNIGSSTSQNVTLRHESSSTAQNVTPMHVDNSTSHNAAHRNIGSSTSQNVTLRHESSSTSHHVAARKVDSSAFQNMAPRHGGNSSTSQNMASRHIDTLTSENVPPRHAYSSTAQNVSSYPANDQDSTFVASHSNTTRRTTEEFPIHGNRANAVSSNIVMEVEEMHINNIRRGKENPVSTSNSTAVLDLEDVNMDDVFEHPLILSGDREVPFTYLASLSAKWAATKGKASSVQGKIKCFLTGVKKFQYKGRERYELLVYVDDGSLICEILIDHDVVQKGIGHSPKEVTAALSSSDAKIVADMKDIFKQFQLFLANFEGTMLVEMNEASPHPVVVEMTQGCPPSDAQLLLRRLNASRSAHPMTPCHPHVPIDISP